MKKTTLLLLSLIITAFAYGQGNSTHSSIDEAFGQSFATQKNQLASTIQTLKETEAANAYWIAYAQFYFQPLLSEFRPE